jgi:hypothetical protein
MRFFYPLIFSHQVAGRPHPYNSLQNDVVRRFLLQRLQDVAEGHDFIHVDDDIRTNAAFLASSRRAVYFEGSNLLVKVDGTDNSTEGACVSVCLKCGCDIGFMKR